MTYYESAEGEVISRARALKEVWIHGASEAEFTEHFGDHAEYEAAEVLEWLVY